MDPIEKVRQAIAEGVRGPELRQLFQELITASNNGDIPADEYVDFIRDEVSVSESLSNTYRDAQEALAPGLEAAAAFLPLPGAGPAAAVTPKALSLLSGAFRFGMRHKVATGVAGAAAAIPFFTEVGGFGAPSVEEQDTGAQISASADRASISRQASNLVGQQPEVVGPEGPSGELPPDKGFNVMVIDHDGTLTGTPGAVAIVTSAQLGMTPSVDLQNLISDQLAPGSGADAMSFLTDYLTSQNTRAAAGIQGREVIGTVFPESISRVTVDSPFQVQASASQIASPGPTLEPIPDTFMPNFPQSVREQEWANQNSGVGTSRENVSLPVGSQVSPRIFNTYRGRTLAEWASLSATRHDVPLNLLYGIIDHESGWVSSAVGDNGNSFGLAQIYLPVWGGSVSQAQALNPVFALEWTAKMLRDRFNQYGRWDAAVAAHNSPVAAQYLVSTGKFQNDKSANYVTDVLNRANKSGLSPYMFGGDEDIPVTAATGPQYTPFQAPDPAQSREYARNVYMELLGREPTEDEYTKEVARIKELARAAYAADLRRLKGGESTAVDVEAQFEEEIRGTGEFAFHEDVTRQRNFTDYAAGVARLLQQGI